MKFHDAKDLHPQVLRVVDALAKDIIAETAQQWDTISRHYPKGATLAHFIATMCANVMARGVIPIVKCVEDGKIGEDRAQGVLDAVQETYISTLKASLESNGCAVTEKK